MAKFFIFAAGLALAALAGAAQAQADSSGCYPIVDKARQQAAKALRHPRNRPEEVNEAYTAYRKLMGEHDAINWRSPSDNELKTKIPRMVSIMESAGKLVKDQLPKARDRMERSKALAAAPQPSRELLVAAHAAEQYYSDLVDAGLSNNSLMKSTQLYAYCMSQKKIRANSASK